VTQEDVLIGIDLGTTNSLAAVLEDSGPTLIPNALGHVLTPSAVSIDDDGSILVGDAARSRAVTHPSRTARMFKRDMGTRRTVALDGHRPMTPEELSAFVLLALKQDAESFLGRPVRRAVITVPAYFGDLQRQATRDAAQIAGLEVERIINEPTAAALAYGLDRRDARGRVAVLDLGGGTFDVTILEIDDGILEIRASSGDARLGGEDFTDRIASLIGERIAETHGAVSAAATHAQVRIRERAEEAKRKLATMIDAIVSLDGIDLGRGPVDVELRLARTDVGLAVASLVERMRAPIRNALRDARMLGSAIDDVVLVGGATRMPWVRALAMDVFGREPVEGVPPDEAIALGAAIQAGLHTDAKAVEDFVVTDIAPFSLGIETSISDESRVIGGQFAPILDRGTVLPASRVESFRTMADNQTEVDVRIFQGEHSLCEDNVELGKMRITGLPRAPAGKTSFDVRFTYDLNGILEVDVEVKSTGKKHQMVIERNPGQMSTSDVSAARSALARLKFHPRESLPNRAALARAEAAYVEANGRERELLGASVRNFRLALEGQDPRAIDAARIAVTDLLASLAATPKR